MKVRANSPSVVRGLFFAPVRFLLCFLLFSFFAALLLFLTEDPTAVLPLASLLSLALSGCVAAFLTAKRTPSGGRALALLSTLLMLALLLLLAAVFGKSMPSGRVWMNGACYLLSAMLGLLLSGVRLGGGRRRRRHRR